MEHKPKTVQEYQTPEGNVPFREWVGSLRDVQAKTRVFSRLERLRFGHFGDCRFVGQGVFELRIHWGPGYRVYFGQDEGARILLLCGGDKNSQWQDIEQAKKYWKDYRGEP